VKTLTSTQRHPDLSDELAFARDLAVEAGDVLLHHFRTDFGVEMKGWADPVTIADREAEALIARRLRERYPTDGLDGEEEGAKAGSSGRLWLIDPLDGTVNYSGGMPLFAVVIALVEEQEEERALLSVTYDPIRRELFHAVRGQGAWLNGERIHVAHHAEIARAMAHIHLSNKSEVWAMSIEVVKRLSRVAPHIRNIGSTAIAQAYVASGRLDAHVKVLSGRWDVVGGNLLVEQAGGVVTALDGGPWQHYGTLLAAGPELHPRFLEVMRGL
jgi:myo-inositol-1(or 4)-monophosphatase